MKMRNIIITPKIILVSVDIPLLLFCDFGDGSCCGGLFLDGVPFLKHFKEQ
jgi:hypothetical protein